VCHGLTYPCVVMPGDEIRECARCAGKTKSGKRCSRNTCMIAKYCWQHVQSVEHFRVGPSTIVGAGRGLFSTRTIRRKRGGNKKQDLLLLPYEGEKLTRAQVNARYGENNAEYVFCYTNEGDCVDGRSTQSCLARMVNACDKPGSKRACNTRLGKKNGQIGVLATRDILANEELFLKYGKDYWK
jgi:hypothetical protein